MFTHPFRFPLLVLVAGMLSACGGSNNDDPAPPPPTDTTAPTVPTGVAATPTTSTAIHVTWNASTDTGGAGLKDYLVYRNGSLVSTQTSSTSFDDSGLTANTLYTYEVSARDNANNESARSTAATATTPPTSTGDTTAPSVPTNLRSTSTQATSVALSWNASTDTGGSGMRDYRVYRNNTAIATVTGTTYTDSTVTASTAYTYQVSARDNALNESARTAALNVTTPAAAVSGLDTRPSNTTCIAPARSVGSSTLSITRAFDVNLTTPVAAVQAPGDSSRWFVAEKGGRVMTFSTSSSAPTPSTFLDIRSAINTAGDEEAGLLGLAFHPNFASNGKFYVFYSGNPNSGYRIQSRISEFTSADRATTSPTTERVLIRADKADSNHNGGQLAFGPDGYLYASLGDGGGADDPNNNAKVTTTLFGKIIRIDVNGTTSGAQYAIPPTNPYAGGTVCPNPTSGFSSSDTFRSPQACPEVYAYGLRNPWRFSFDRGSPSAPDLWVGDVGQGAYEEINRIQTGGGHYGWDVREGLVCHEPSTGCATTGMIDPIAAAPRSSGLASIIGGFVYRGSAIPGLVGRYLFTDFYTRGIYVYDSSATNGYTALLNDSGVTAAAFAQDNDGELYLVDYAGGDLHKLGPGSGGGSPVPSLLSQTGCVASNPTQPAAGLVPFAPNAPFWSDGSSKERWMALPNNTTISVVDGDWAFPTGTVLMKNFRLQGQLIETRLLMRHPDGEWAGYTYQWNTAQTEATRVTGGATVPLGSPSQNWVYPSEAQCVQCHTSAAGRSLGPETFQLNGNLTYATTGRSANQITTLEHIGLLPSSMPDAATLPVLPDPFGSSGTLAERARSYLHTNCSFCHRPGGGAPGTMDLRYQTAMASTNTCDATPTSGDLGVTGAKIITPADANASVLYLRMNRRGTNQMPPIGSTVVDTAGAALLQQWISAMGASCN